MCILPNFATRDLKELEQKKEKGNKKTEAKKLEIIIPKQPMLENST
jgi:hypothetical protein